MSATRIENSLYVPGADRVIDRVVAAGTVPSGSDLEYELRDAASRGRASFFNAMDGAGIVHCPPKNASGLACWPQVHHPYLTDYGIRRGWICALLPIPFLTAAKEIGRTTFADGFECRVDKTRDARADGQLVRVLELAGLHRVPHLADADSLCLRLPLNRIHILARLALDFVDAAAAPSRGARGTTYFDTRAASLVYSGGFGSSFVRALAEEGSGVFNVPPRFDLDEPRFSGCPG